MPKFVNRKRIESPLKNWPGHIIVPLEVEPDQYCRYWEIYCQQEDGDDKRPEVLKGWSSRYHLVLEWHIEGLSADMIDESGLKLPSLRIATFVIAATQQILIEARSLPNLPEPLNDG